MIGSDRRDHTQAQRPRERLVEDPRGLLEVRHLGQDPARPPHDLDTGGRRQHAAPAPLEEPGVEQFFERPDLVAEARLAHVTGLGCCVEAAPVGDRHGVLELAQGRLHG